MLAGYMQQRLEVRRGERVLLMLPEYPPLAIGWYAALRCDAGVIALDPGSTAGEVAGCLRESGARIDASDSTIRARGNGALQAALAACYSLALGAFRVRPTRGRSSAG